MSEPIPEMVETVGAAIGRALDADAVKEILTRGAISPETAWRIARVAIETMREPTEAMVEAGNCRVYAEHLHEEMAGDNTTMTWEAMIAAALR